MPQYLHFFAFCYIFLIFAGGFEIINCIYLALVLLYSLRKSPLESEAYLISPTSQGDCVVIEKTAIPNVFEKSQVIHILRHRDFSLRSK
jgi:hypothetical protein